MDFSASTIWALVGLAALLILAAVLLTILRHRSEMTPPEHPRIEPTDRPSWTWPAAVVDVDEPLLATDYGTWTPTIESGGEGEFTAQILEVTGNYSVTGRDAEVDCELTFLLRVSNSVGDAFVGGIPVAAAGDIEVMDATLEEIEASRRDTIPLRSVIFKNDTRLYLGISGREFRCGPTYRFRFRASYEAAAY